MQRVVVTGGAGFIGSNLVDKLIEQGKEVLIIDNLSTGKKENINPNAKFLQLDLDAYTSSVIAEEIKGYDVVFHMAALPQVQQSIENPTNNNNINSTINILEASRKANIKRVIFSSTSALYGNPVYTPIDESHPINPLSPYALHKLVGENYCKLYSEIYDLDTVCLRYFNVYGNRMSNEGAYRSVISIFQESFLNKIPFNIVNDGEQKRDFVHVNDIIEANILCALNNKLFNGSIFNVGTGKAYTVNEIADMFGGEKQYGETRIEPKDSVADNSAILKLGWKPKGVLFSWIKNFKKTFTS
jgi:UDP-glucose 4-epimerase|tara:strand:+ start:139 stop:1038 length:900 start_codon:yes stop_codon:yes gene_type:complete